MSVTNKNAEIAKRPLPTETNPVVETPITKKAKKIKTKKYKAKKVDPTSPLGVFQFEIAELLKEQGIKEADTINDITAILNDASSDGQVKEAYHRKVNDVKVLKLTSSGDGLAIIDNPVESDKKQVVIIPFGLPGDIVHIRVFKTHPNYVESDLLDVNAKSDIRRDDLINCKYFGKCSGSQYQNLTYETQLKLKQDTVSNAYKFFAPRLIEKKILPEVGTTIGSPLQYEYRTKLTPHFDIPRRIKKAGELKERPPLGFGQKGRPTWRKETLHEGGNASTLDIEEYTIGTSIINKGLKNERRKFEKEFNTYKKGATILLRENTIVMDKDSTEEQIKERLKNEEGSRDKDGNISYEVHMSNDGDKKLIKTCVTQPRQIVNEYVNGYSFQFSAGEFFQNNNSILPIVTKYVRDNLQLPEGEHNYLVDAYCGSGLFSICSSEGVDKVVGVEISADSVKFARINSELNKIANCKFIVGKAEKLFEEIDLPNDRTSVILDPPRKGCDELFLKQLSEFNPAKIVYISCNVHSQARDLEYFLLNTLNGKNYKIESLRGFDFFPQTHHVESVCVLSRV